MNKVESITPGPKPNKPDGTPDRRRRVRPKTQPHRSVLQSFIHQPGEQ